MRYKSGLKDPELPSSVSSLQEREIEDPRDEDTAPEQSLRAGHRSVMRNTDAEFLENTLVPCLPREWIDQPHDC